MATAAFFDAGLGAHLDAAATRAKRIVYSGTTKDDSTCWEVGAFHMLHEIVGSCLGVVDERKCCVDDFAHVVWRNAGGHTHSNALATVHQ